jgi:hypothetical protein
MNNATGVKPGVVRLLRFLGERFITSCASNVTLKPCALASLATT